jgi:hypothetical protein
VIMKSNDFEILTDLRFQAPEYRKQFLECHQSFYLYAVQFTSA